MLGQRQQFEVAAFLNIARGVQGPLVARAQGGLTLSPEGGELDTDFCHLGISPSPRDYVETIVAHGSCPSIQSCFAARRCIMPGREHFGRQVHVFELRYGVQRSRACAAQFPYLQTSNSPESSTYGNTFPIDLPSDCRWTDENTRITKPGASRLLLGSASARRLASRSSNHTSQGRWIKALHLERGI